jgi:hypothetical protein
MLMVKKKSNKKNSVSIWLRAHKFTTALMALVVVVAGIFAYNKILDRQNVQDMKELLAAFEQLERDVEADTGDQLTIEADCGSVGKFAEGYSCGLFLKNLQNKWTEEISQSIQKKNDKLFQAFCKFASFNSIGLSADKDFYLCILTVRKSNRSTAESIFYQYDISPGRAF